MSEVKIAERVNVHTGDVGSRLPPRLIIYDGSEAVCHKESFIPAWRQCANVKREQWDDQELVVVANLQYPNLVIHRAGRSETLDDHAQAH